MSSLWVEATDLSTNRVYYYNKETKQTQWTRPPDMEESKTDAADDVPGNWAESSDNKTGRKYFYNKVTKKTTWTKPKCLLSPHHSRTTSTVTATVALTSLPPALPLPSVNAGSKGGSPAHSTTVSPRGPPPLPASVTNTAAAAVPVVRPTVEWAEAKDPATGRSYWYNKETKETTWVNPAPSATLMTMNPLSASPAPSVNNTMTPHSYRYTAGSNAPFTADMLQQSLQTLQVSHPIPEESKQTTPPPLPSSGEKRDLHSLLDMEDDGPSSEDEGDSAATSPAGSKRGTLSPADAATLTTQIVRDRLEGDTASDAAQLHFAKHRKGWFKRTFRVGSVFTAEKLLEFKKSLIKKSLLKENRHLDALAIQLFKNVMSYMGDRKSSKGSKEHCKKILKLCLSAPTGIRDEVYVQLMKQTTKNPKRESERKGWEVLTQCLSFFPPSKMIVDTVRDYIEKTIIREGGQTSYPNNSTNIATIKQMTRDQHSVLTLAYLALTYLPMVQQQGPRLNIPCEFELNAIVEFTPMYLTVFTCHDGLSHSIKVDAFTRVRDVVQQLSMHFNISTGHDLTALYESQGNDPAIFSQHPPTGTKPSLVDSIPCDTGFFTQRKLNEERQCDDDWRVLDVVSSWENPALVEEVLEEGGDEGYNSAFIKKDDKLYKKNKKEMTKMTLDEIMQEKLHVEKSHNLYKFNRLVYKLRLVTRITEPSLSHDREAVTLLFYQLFRDFVIERYPLIEKDVTNLIALFLQTHFGNYSAEKWTLKKLQEVGHQVIPWSFRASSSSADTFYQTILTKYQKLMNFSAYEAMLSYLDYCQANPYYGCQSFLVEQRQFQEHPNILWLSVTCNGVLFLHPDLHLEKEILDADATKDKAKEGEKERRERDKKENKLKVLENFGYSDLVTWGNSDEKFILVIGNIIQQRKLILKTKEGKVINCLIHEYVKRKVQQRERAISK